MHVNSSWFQLRRPAAVKNAAAKTIPAISLFILRHCVHKKLRETGSGAGARGQQPAGRQDQAERRHLAQETAAQGESQCLAFCGGLLFVVYWVAFCRSFAWV